MINLSILTPHGSREASVQAVFLPGSSGSFEVLPKHAPIISTLQEGEIVWRDAQGKEERLKVKGGVMRCQEDKMHICAEL